MLTAVESVVVDVADLEVAARDYACLLGRAPSLLGPDPLHGGRIARFPLSNTTLELRAPGGGRAGGGEGVAGLRLAGRFEAGGALRPGRVAGPSVPIELVAEVRGGEGPGAASGALGPGGAGEAAVDPAARVEGLDHVVVASPDPERTRRHFAEELGLRLALDRRFPERGLRLLFFRLGGITLEVAASLAESPPGAEVAGRDAFHGLAWRVPRLDAVHARLLAAGLPIGAIRAGHKAGTRVASLRGTFHGVPTLLIEPAPRPGGDPAA